MNKYTLLLLLSLVTSIETMYGMNATKLVEELEKKYQDAQNSVIRALTRKTL